MTAIPTTVTAATPMAVLQFIAAANGFVAALDEIASSLRSSAPGTARLLLAYAQREAGTALDLVQSWP